MLVITAAAAAAAAWVYPWPKAIIVSDAVNKPLFEDFNTRSVRSIRVETYNDDRNEIERLLVRRKGESWLLPTHNDFVADNGRQLGAVVNLLLDKTVLEKRSDNQEDHLKYGVVDPADINSAVNRSSLGKKISLADRNNKEIASLIVGLPVKNDPKQLKHYVRVPGQPSVYVVEIDPRTINPDFRAWVNPNLLKLTQSTRLKDVTIESYRLNPKKIADAERETIYQSQLTVNEQQIDIKLRSTGDEGQMRDTESTGDQQQTLQQAAGSITAIPFSDVLAKSKPVAKALRKPAENTNKSTFESMQKYGFRATQFDAETWQFEAVGGSVEVRTADGVVISILIGAIDSQARNNSLKLNHYLMLVAGFDESLVPMPEKPTRSDNSDGNDEDNDAEDGDSASDDFENEDDQKVYLRKVAERERQLKIGRQRASALNESFSKWYYIVSEDIVSRLRPELKDTEL